jgi:hypothetical protein
LAPGGEDMKGELRTRQTCDLSAPSA